MHQCGRCQQLVLIIGRLRVLGCPFDTAPVQSDVRVGQCLEVADQGSHHCIQMVLGHFFANKGDQTVGEGQDPLVHDIGEAGMAQNKLFAILKKQKQ